MMLNGQQRRRLATLLSALLLVMLATSVAQACPTCKDGMTHDPDTANMIRGYFWSILFMMSMPFLIFGGLATYFYLLVRSARKSQLAAAPAQA